MPDKEIYTYANGAVVTEVLDKYGRIVREYLGTEATPRIENIYSDTEDIANPVVSGTSKIYRTIDRYAGKVYNTEYDEYGEAVRTRQEDASSGTEEIATEIYRDGKRRVKGTTEVGKTIYAYRTSGWKDQLISLSEGGTAYAFAYDGCGNPTQYKSTVQNMWWTRGRMLERYKSGSTDVSYK